MRRKAFTLVELMVVLAVIVLLAAMILPSMSSVFAVGRATVCRGNLERLGNAFSIANSAKVTVSGANSALTGVYPRPMIWPSIPRSAVDDPSLYHCPEEPGKGKAGVGDMFKNLEYECEYGKFPMNTLAGASGFYKAQSGEDPVKGAYTDYLLQDDYGNGQFEMMEFHGWVDSDGVVRVWHSGEVFVYDRIPATGGWEYTDTRFGMGPGRPTGCNTCGNLNAIWWRGKGAWGSNGAVQGVRGQTFKLDGWDPGFTNYGISSEIYRYPYGSKAIVLVDYKDLIVDLDWPLQVQENLANEHSARHLGRLNILYGDGSVKAKPPLAISPLLYPEVWEP